MNKEKYYLALDLELNNSSDGSTPNPPIIQVGVAYGNYNDYLDNTIKTRKWYIDPKEPIFPFITSLTGITDDDIKNFAISHDEIAQELSFLVSCFKIGNPITWGGGDITELKNEFNSRHVLRKDLGADIYIRKYSGFVIKSHPLDQAYIRSRTTVFTKT